MPKKLTKSVGFLLIPENGPIKRHRGFAGDQPDRVEVAAGRRVRPAREVFNTEEMERRIAHYAARAAERLPLFGPGTVEPEPAIPTKKPRNGKPATVAPNRLSQCCCCAEAVATSLMVAAGWRSRPILGDDEGQIETESYCPVCFDQFAWGDDD